MPWYVYEDEDHFFEFPIKFQFESINSDDDSKKNFKETIVPHVLPANLFAGKIHQSFEFYHPSIAAR